jgi:hypothetical protein
MVDVSDTTPEADAEETTETTTASAPPAPKKTVEEWALAAGMLPEHFVVPAPAGHLPVAPRHNPKFWMFNGARAGSRWPQGAEVTEAEFDAAIEKATTGVSR